MFLVFHDWLHLLSIALSMLVSVVAWIQCSVPVFGWIVLPYVYITFWFPISWWVFGCFYFLTIRTRLLRTSVSTYLHGQMFTFSWVCVLPQSKITGSYDGSVFNLWTRCTFSDSLAVCKDCSVSTVSPAFVVVNLFDFNQPGGWEMISHCGFDVHFPDG